MYTVLFTTLENTGQKTNYKFGN